MSKSDQQFQDVLSTGEEALRLLEALESEQPPSDETPVPEVVYVNADLHTRIIEQTTTSKNQVEFKSILLSIVVASILYVSFLIFSQNTQKKPSSASITGDSLSFSISCGSPFSTTGRWWRITSVANRSLLENIRSRFCGDAFINAEGVLQVASFGSWSEADVFRKRITESTGEAFSIGEWVPPDG